MSKKSVGIIGCGNVAGTYYLPALKQLGFTQIAVYDSNQDHVRAFTHQNKVKSVTLNELIKHSDILILTTPPASHYELIMQCLLPGKTIICEKPFVLHGKDAEQAVQQAKAVGCNIYIAHIRRTFANINLAKGFLHQQPYGDLIKAELFEGSIFHYKTSSGYVTTDKYGGVLYDTGSHVLDSFLYVAGISHQPLNITVESIVTDKVEPSHEWTGKFSLNNIPVYLKLSRYETLSNKMNLYFSRGMVEIPLMPHAAIRIREGNKSGLLQAETGIINYFSEAFKCELSEILIKENKEKFGAEHFIQLNYLLEKLYQHTH